MVFSLLLKRSKTPKPLPLPLPLSLATRNPNLVRASPRSTATSPLGSSIAYGARALSGTCRPSRCGEASRSSIAPLLGLRSFSSPATTAAAAIAKPPRTCDGLTVDAIVGKGWTILDEGESDWRSHAAAIAQSVQVIKKRLQVRGSFFTFNHTHLVLSLQYLLLLFNFFLCFIKYKDATLSRISVFCRNQW